MAQSLYELSHWNAVIKHGSPVEEVKTNGIITDLTLPTLEMETNTDKRAGELGVVARPGYFNELEVSFTVKNIFEDFLEAILKGVNQSIEFVATACIQTDAGTPQPYKVASKGFITTLPFGELSADGMEQEISMMCWYMEARLGTKTIVYDPRNFILSIDGTNLYENVKAIVDPPVT